MAPAIVEKSIIIDFSHKILLSISIYFRYNQLIIIDFYQKLSVIDFIDWTHRASPSLAWPALATGSTRRRRGSKHVSPYTLHKPVFGFCWFFRWSVRKRQLALNNGGERGTIPWILQWANQPFLVSEIPFYYCVQHSVRIKKPLLFWHVCKRIGVCRRFLASQQRTPRYNGRNSFARGYILRHCLFV